MNAQELIQKSALIEKVIKEQGLQEKAGPFISENAVIKTEELEKTIKGMQAENRGLKVGIIGRVKAGKSSLLNALIFEGKDVLPKAATTETSSLIILKYAQNLSAQVQFYSQKDILEIKNKHARYEKKFKEIVSEEIKKLEEKQQGLLNKTKEGVNKISKWISINKIDEEVLKQKILSPEEIRERAQKIAKNELDNDAKLSTSHDQYEKIKKSELTNTEKLDPHIQANSLGELNQKLLQFVGANGKFMPYTKAVQISLNNPNLKDLEVIDTLGVNDPIVSREERTKALLKECDVVFVISPSNQFLTGSDMDLFDRVSNKEGIQMVYFVASQTDSTIVSEAEKFDRNLKTAVINTQKILSSQLNKTMEGLIQECPNQKEIFKNAKKNGVILTSGVCYSLYQDFENQFSWKEEHQLAWKNLKKHYPDAFDSDEARENLKRLSNIDAIRERLEEAAKEKENIISQRLQEYLKSQANNLSSLVANLLRELESEKDRIRRADLNKILVQLKEYERLSDKIETDFKDAYEEFVIDFINEIEDVLNKTLEELIGNAEKGSKTHEGEKEVDEIRSKMVKTDGLWGSIGRALDLWGYEEKQYIVKVTRNNIKAGAVVDLLIEMHDECAKALNRDAESFKSVFKEKLYEKILSKLREII
ncbi:dynamin family protein [Helicobacter pylori]